MAQGPKKAKKAAEAEKSTFRRQNLGKKCFAPPESRKKVLLKKQCLTRMVVEPLVDEPTAKLIREELLPIASTVGTHSLALPVCDKTRRVAEVASELHASRWSKKLHALCGERQRDAVMAVLTIMRRTGQGTRPRGEDETGDPYEQVGKLPRWMHSVIDDVWWKVLEMMGMW